MKYILLLFLVISSSCKKEEMTSYQAYIENTTSHKIVIHPFFSGTSPLEKRITLQSNEKFQIASGSDRGLGNQGFSSSYFGGVNDSLIVVFDDLYSVTHYANTPSSLARKYYLFSSSRNISNPNSYLIQTNQISKYQQENTFTYKFVEQDYLDAR